MKILWWRNASVALVTFALIQLIEGHVGASAVASSLSIITSIIYWIKGAYR